MNLSSEMLKNRLTVFLIDFIIYLQKAKGSTLELLSSGFVQILIFVSNLKGTTWGYLLKNKLNRVL